VRACGELRWERGRWGWFGRACAESEGNARGELYGDGFGDGEWEYCAECEGDVEHELGWEFQREVRRYGSKAGSRRRVSGSGRWNWVCWRGCGGKSGGEPPHSKIGWERDAEIVRRYEERITPRAQSGVTVPHGQTQELQDYTLPRWGPACWTPTREEANSRATGKAGVLAAAEVVRGRGRRWNWVCWRGCGGKSGGEPPHSKKRAQGAT